MNVFEVQRGNSPLVLAQPHGGTFLPDGLSDRLNARGQQLADTDWHIDRLYDSLAPSSTVIRSNIHRYVIDANRDPTGNSLYPGQNTTTLVPLTDFDGLDIWEVVPDEIEIARRREAFHRPYHDALRAELDRVRAIHGVAILYDCHSIRSNIPFLFKGTLPDFNIGTNMGVTCAPEIEAATARTCAKAEGYSSTLNGRFKGGWTTRHYGRPNEDIHAIQMELAQSTYLAGETPPWSYDTKKADRLRHHLIDILTTLADLAPTLGR